MSCILITPGEPAGIGPDIVIGLAAHNDVLPPFVVVASQTLITERAAKLNLPIEVQTIDLNNKMPDAPAPKGTLRILDIPLTTPVIPGVLNSANASYVLNTLDTAIELCLNKKALALVTGPVHKGIINDAGINFTGHTEYLRDAANVEDVVMMLATPHLKVALVTTHLPLAKVSNAITQSHLKTTVRILHQSLQHDFQCKTPRILVSGLNPHAGEEGHLGTEEITTIIPALASLAKEGIQTVGPLPADTLFQPHHLQNTDAVLAMYHDQGLPVLKYQGFGKAVNITLGLPFIRTSVDHGTALSLAGMGTAHGTSLIEALNTAAMMSRSRQPGFM